MIKIEKRYWAFAGLVVLLCLTGYVNYLLNNNASEKQPVALVDDSVPAGADVAEVPVELSDTGAEIQLGEAQPVSNFDAVAASGNYYANFRTQRQSSRVQEIAWCDEIMADTNADEESKKEAQQTKLAFIRSTELETTIEGLVMAKGFSECVATVRTGSVNIVVENAEPLTGAQAAQILEIAMRETGEAAENINVMPKN